MTERAGQGARWPAVSRQRVNIYTVYRDSLVGIPRIGKPLVFKEGFPLKRESFAGGGDTGWLSTPSSTLLPAARLPSPVSVPVDFATGAKAHDRSARETSHPGRGTARPVAGCGSHLAAGCGSRPGAGCGNHVAGCGSHHEAGCGSHHEAGCGSHLVAGRCSHPVAGRCSHPVADCGSRPAAGCGSSREAGSRRDRRARVAGHHGRGYGGRTSREGLGGRGHGRLENCRVGCEPHLALAGSRPN